MKMPKLSGMDILREIKKITPHMAVIILTGTVTWTMQFFAMKEGALNISENRSQPRIYQ